MVAFLSRRKYENPALVPDFASVESVRVGIAGEAFGPNWRKVRAPQGRVPGNARAPQGDGKCSREQTADGRACTAQVRVKGCGKSAPGRW